MNQMKIQIKLFDFLIGFYNFYLMGYTKLLLEELIELCIKDDMDAREELYNRYCNMVYNWLWENYAARRIITDNPDIDIADIFKVVWRKVFAKLDSIKNKKKFPGWLKPTTWHAIVDFNRKKGKIQEKEISLDTLIGENTETLESLIGTDKDSLEQEIFKKIEIEALFKAIDELPEKDKNLILQFYFNKIQVEKIAKSLHQTTFQIYNRLNLLRLELKKQLKGVYLTDDQRVNELNVILLYFLFEESEEGIAKVYDVPQPMIKRILDEYRKKIDLRKEIKRGEES